MKPSVPDEASEAEDDPAEALDDADGDDDADDASVHKESEDHSSDSSVDKRSWERWPGHNCVDSSGGEAMITPKDMEGDNTLEDCQAGCLRTMGCEGVLRLQG